MKPHLPTCGPCRRRLADGTLEDAPYSVAGYDPYPSEGRGVIYWAWSLDEAKSAAIAYRAHGYREVRVLDEKNPRSQEIVHEMIFGVQK